MTMKYLLIILSSSILSVFSTIAILTNFPELWNEKKYQLEYFDDNDNARVSIGIYQSVDGDFFHGIAFHDSAGSLRMVIGTRDDDYSPFIRMQNEDTSYAGGINIVKGHAQLLLGSIQGSYVQLVAPSHLDTRSASAINLAGGDTIRSDVSLHADNSPSITLTKGSYQSFMALHLPEKGPTIVATKDLEKVFEITE